MPGRRPCVDATFPSVPWIRLGSNVLDSCVLLAHPIAVIEEVKISTFYYVYVCEQTRTLAT